jgi:hypothetical protein
MYERLINQKISKKYMYVRTRISGEYVPLIIFLGFYFGLENVLTRYEVNYIFEEKRRNLTDEEKSKYSSIIFNDGILYYESIPNRNSILLSGLAEMNTKEYNFADFNSQDIYLDYFELAYGSRNKSKGFKNILSVLIDPITKDVLNYLGQPDDLLGVLLYANTLLEDNSYTEIDNMSNYRLRSVEILNAQLYQILADAVITYKDYHKSGRNDVRISVPPDALKKQLLESPIIEEYSVLSPVLEIERLGCTNYKGLGGTNLDSAFTKDMRAYDKSMIGMLAMSSPDSNKVGVVRQLSYNCKVKNTLGIIDTEKEPNDLEATDMLTAGELMSVYTSLHADPPRIGMQTQQAKHSVPTVKQSRPLYGSGVERTLPYLLSSDFVSVAKDNGVVEKVDEKNELAVIKYNDGSSDVIDLSDKQSKNSNGG